MEKELLEIIYQDDNLLIGKSDRSYYMYVGEVEYQLSCHAYEPCFYIHGTDGMIIAIHNAFTLGDIVRLAKSNGFMKMITSDEYDIKGICKLLRKAIALSMEPVDIKYLDISYLEGCCFIDYLEECGAISEGTAVALTGSGINNPNVITSFVHSNKKINRTDDERYFIEIAEK